MDSWVCWGYSGCRLVCILWVVLAVCGRASCVFGFICVLLKLSIYEVFGVVGFVCLVFFCL